MSTENTTDLSMISYSEDAGLSIKNKKGIFNDIESFFKTAYGNDLDISEGTELYSFIDILSQSLSDTCSSVKSLYSAFGFMYATGDALDILCSNAGITRKENESDTKLRSRYYVSLFKKSIGTMQGLKEKVYSISDYIQEVSVTEYITSKSVLVYGTTSKTMKANSICCVVRFTDDTMYFKNKSSSSENYAQAKILSETISKYINEYKSLGCATNGELPTDGTDFNMYYEAQKANKKLKLYINWYNTDDKTKYKDTFYDSLRNLIYDYVSSIDIGVSITYTGIVNCIFNANAKLNLGRMVAGISSVLCNDTSITEGGSVGIGLCEINYTENNTTYINIVDNE